jgi:transcription antitermination protein NusB
LGARRRAREIALQLLYQMEANPVDPREALELFWQGLSASQPIKEFVGRIVEGVHGKREEIDKLLKKHSEHWRLDRMDRVDKSILRMGVFEILFCDDIPARVAMNEAVDLGKKFGAEESGAFINGILDKISKTEGKVQP